VGIDGWMHVRWMHVRLAIRAEAEVVDEVRARICMNAAVHL
jgi:hypothetical protein